MKSQEENKEAQSFVLESSLVAVFTDSLKNTDRPFALEDFALEFDHHGGRVDLVAISEAGELWTFEAKLKDWRTAVNQAYRNTSFAHYSYVILPQEAATNAFRNERYFAQRGVGLCTIIGSDIVIVIPAAKKEPLRPWITENAIRYAECA